MKKIMIVFSLMLSFNLYSLDHGLITGFEAGYNIMEGLRVNDELVTNNSDSLFIKLQTGYRLENLRVVGTYTSTLLQIDWDSYNPVQDRFRIDINYTWRYLTIGFFHWCDHPVVSHIDNRSTLANSGQRAVYIKFYREH